MSDPLRRQPRHRRRSGVAVHLTERDEVVLQALARFRLARTSDLLAYAFAGVRPDTAAVRLRRLFDARYLAVLPPRLGAENVYRLGPAATRHLSADGVGLGRIPRGGHEHHLAIVRTWVALSAIEDLQLERCLPDWEIRERFPAGELHVVPDLFMLVRSGPERYAVAVEVDLGTESQAVHDRKLGVYRSLWGSAPGLFGWEHFGIAVVACAGSRRARVNSALKKAWVVPHVLWTDSEGPSAVLHKLFEELGTPLGASPYRKGSGVAAAPQDASEDGAPGTPPG